MVERLWHFIKYTLLHEKVKKRLYLLIEAIIKDPHIGERFGGATLVKHFKNKQALNASEKYSKRAMNTTHTIRMQKANHLVEMYRNAP